MKTMQEPVAITAAAQPQPPMWYSGIATRPRPPCRSSGTSKSNRPSRPVRLRLVSMAPLGSPVVPEV